MLINGLPFSKSSFFLVCVKQTKNFDYTLMKTFSTIIKNKMPGLVFNDFNCNYKYAAVKAGLGQYAKNSLFYHPVFQFETHIEVFLIQNEIIDLPERKSADFNLLSLCNNCNDCINACPVGAINDNNERIWINTWDCDNFCGFSNHPIIPSIKWNWFVLDDEKRSLFSNKQDIAAVQSYADLKKISNKTSCRYITINNQSYQAIFPICRECTSQKRCSKYNGKYPYDFNDVQLLKIKE